MKLDQVPYGQTEQLRLRWHAASLNLPGAIVPGAEAVLLYAEHESKVMLRVGEEVLGVEGAGRRNEELLADLCTRHLPRLTWVVDAGQQYLTIQVHTFLKSLPVPPMELGVDEKVLEALERIDRKLRSPERALKWLEEQFLLNPETGSVDLSQRTLRQETVRSRSSDERYESSFVKQSERINRTCFWLTRLFVAEAKEESNLPCSREIFVLSTRL